MKQLTINMPENKYPVFLEMIKKLDFISISKDDWFENLSFLQKNNIQKGIEDLENGNFHSHEFMKAFSKSKISVLKNSL